MNTETVEIYVQLLEEGTPTARPTKAVSLGNSTYKILPTPDYDPENEIWEFLPGSIVFCEFVEKGWAKKMLMAIKLAI